jgi:hypothetical protein
MIDGHRLDLVGLHLHPHAPVVARGQEVVDHVEALLPTRVSAPAISMKAMNRHSGSSCRNGHADDVLTRGDQRQLVISHHMVP